MVGRLLLLSLLSQGKDRRKCVLDLELGGVLVMMVIVLLIMDGPVLVHALLAIHQLLGHASSQDHTLLHQDVEVTTLLPHAESSHVIQNHHGISQEIVMTIETAGHILPVIVMLIDMKLTMVIMKSLHAVLRDPTGGHQGVPQVRLLDRDQGLQTCPLAAASNLKIMELYAIFGVLPQQKDFVRTFKASWITKFLKAIYYLELVMVCTTYLSRCCLISIV